MSSVPESPPSVKYFHSALGVCPGALSCPKHTWKPGFKDSLILDLLNSVGLKEVVSLIIDYVFL